MSDLGAVEEQLVEAMCRAVQPRYGDSPNGDATLRERMRAALNVVRTERSQITCPTCGGTGTIWRAEREPIYSSSYSRCPACNGTKSVPGELLVVGLIGGER